MVVDTIAVAELGADVIYLGPLEIIDRGNSIQGTTPTGKHVHNRIVRRDQVLQAKIDLIGENGWMKKLPKEYNLMPINLDVIRDSRVEHNGLQKEMKNLIDVLRCNG